MKPFRIVSTTRVRRAFCATGALTLLLLPSPAPAQETAPATPPAPTPRRSTAATTTTLARALERLGAKSGVVVLADSTVAYEKVAAPAPTDSAPAAPAVTGLLRPDAEAALESEIKALVRTLPPGTIWGKLYLPAPAPGRAWKGDDLTGFALAQARLFGRVGTPATDGSIEILSKRVSREAAPAYVEGLGLRPVYLVTNPGRQMAGAAMPWSPLAEDRWASLSRDERRQYGQQQAEWIMSLPPDQRQQMLDRIQQHDRYFETVKSPLEKLLGRDL